MQTGSMKIPLVQHPCRRFHCSRIRMIAPYADAVTRLRETGDVVTIFLRSCMSREFPFLLYANNPRKSRESAIGPDHPGFILDPSMDRCTSMPGRATTAPCSSRVPGIDAYLHCGTWREHPRPLGRFRRGSPEVGKGHRGVAETVGRGSRRALRERAQGQSLPALRERGRTWVARPVSISPVRFVLHANSVPDTWLSPC